jgi:hypothetical protein
MTQVDNKKICGIDEAVVSTPRRLSITINREKHISPWLALAPSFFNGCG